MDGRALKHSLYVMSAIHHMNVNLIQPRILNPGAMFSSLICM